MESALPISPVPSFGCLMLWCVLRCIFIFHTFEVVVAVGVGHIIIITALIAHWSAIRIIVVYSIITIYRYIGSDHFSLLPLALPAILRATQLFVVCCSQTDSRFHSALIFLFVSDTATTMLGRSLDVAKQNERQNTRRHCSTGFHLFVVYFYRDWCIYSMGSTGYWWCTCDTNLLTCWALEICCARRLHQHHRHQFNIEMQ